MYNGDTSSILISNCICFHFVSYDNYASSNAFGFSNNYVSSDNFASSNTFDSSNNYDSSDTSTSFDILCFL